MKKKSFTLLALFSITLLFSSCNDSFEENVLSTKENDVGGLATRALVLDSLGTEEPIQLEETEELKNLKKKFENKKKQGASTMAYNDDVNFQSNIYAIRELPITIYAKGVTGNTNDTLQLSSEFINKLTYNTMGMIDINLYFFYPDIGTKYDNCFKTMNDRREIIDKCVRRKQTCLLDTKHLIKNDIYSWKWNMLRKLSNECLRFINQLTPRQRLGLFILSGYGIKMQIGVHLLNTSISRLFDDNRKRKICYFYDDIKECIDSYAPRLVSENHVFVDDKNEVFTNYDKIYSRKEDIVPINISEFGLYESMLAEKSIKDIFDNNDNSDSDNTLIQDAIINRLRELENMHLLFYIQLLK